MTSFLPSLRLDERVVLITGGAGPVGRALGELMVELGARVALTDVSADALAQQSQHLASLGAAGTHTIAASLLDPGSPARIVGETVERFGRLDVLINNAAFTGASGLPGYAVPFAEQTVEAFEAALRVNLTAVFQLCQLAAEPLGRHGKGAIVNVASIYGVVGPNLNLYTGTRMGNPAGYGASKGGVVQLTRYLSTVLAPRVRVNCISPGGIERGQPEDFQARYRGLTPLGRMGNEDDLKGAVALLSTDAGSYLTGVNLPVDGGWTAW